MDFSLINIIILFGAIQGFTLSWVLFKKNRLNLRVMRFFILFLFSLSFLNLFYALMDAHILDLYKPLYVFPFPYRYLIGVGFFLYVKYSFQKTNSSKMDLSLFLLFVPAILFAMLHVYWFSVSIYENSYRIVSSVVNSNFFRINEFVYLFFTIALIIRALKILKDHKNNTLHPKEIKNIKWLKLLSTLFLIKLIVDLLLFSIDLMLHSGKESLLFFYPNFIINSVFIYWIGYIGFLKPHILMAKIRVSNEEDGVSSVNMEEQLSHLINNNEIYRNKKLTISDVALQLNIKEQDLSNFINAKYKKNFPEYINEHRVNKVKELIKIDLEQKFTLLALADQAGFNSKSTFNSTFKKVLGVTPTQYKKDLKLQ